MSLDNHWRAVEDQIVSMAGASGRKPRSGFRYQWRPQNTAREDDLGQTLKGEWRRAKHPGEGRTQRQALLISPHWQVGPLSLLKKLGLPQGCPEIWGVPLPNGPDPLCHTQHRRGGVLSSRAASSTLAQTPARLMGRDHTEASGHPEKYPEQRTLCLHQVLL